MTVAALRAARTLGGVTLTLALTGGLLTAVAAGPANAAPLPSAKAAAKAKTTTIASQPKSATINRYGTGTSATLKVKASGTKLKYAWQSRTGVRVVEEHQEGDQVVLQGHLQHMGQRHQVPGEGERQ